MDRPLSDLVVLDLTRALAGPIAGRLLSDLGADVIKVEPPAGDLTRTVLPRVDGMATYYAQYNAGKRCVSIDLAGEDGRELFLRMVERADVVLENYRPDVMRRLRLTYDDLAERNQRIVMASISGWGHGNARSDQGAFAGTIHAETGVTAKVAERRGEPVPRNDPMSHADVYTGLHALAALLAAVHLRDRTGHGQAVEVSMAESTLMANDLVAAELSGLEPASGFRAGQNFTPIYTLSTGRHVTITADPTTDGGFWLWCRAMDRPDLAEDERFTDDTSRIANRAELDAELTPWVATFDDPGELESRFGHSAVMAAEVRSATEVATTPWAAERGAFVAVDTGRGETVTVPQSPWRFRDADSGARPWAGHRGQHNREVLAELLGATDDELDAWEADGVISDRPPRWRR